MEKALSNLLDQLDLVAEDCAEILDSDVRQNLSEAIFNSFIDPILGYELPDDFGLFSEEGNQKVRTAVKLFIDNAIAFALEENLTTAEERLGEFQNDDIHSRLGSVYDDYFGYSEVC